MWSRSRSLDALEPLSLLELWSRSQFEQRQWIELISLLWGMGSQRRSDESGGKIGFPSNSFGVGGVKSVGYSVTTIRANEAFSIPFRLHDILVRYKCSLHTFIA